MINIEDLQDDTELDPHEMRKLRGGINMVNTIITSYSYKPERETSASTQLLGEEPIWYLFTPPLCPLPWWNTKA